MKRILFLFFVMVGLASCTLFPNETEITPLPSTPMELLSSATPYHATTPPEAVPEKPITSIFPPITLKNANGLVEVSSTPLENASLLAWLSETNELIVRSNNKVIAFNVLDLTISREFVLPENASLLSFNPARELLAITTDRLAVSIHSFNGQEIQSITPDGGFGSAGFEPHVSQIWFTSMEEFRANAYEVETGERSRDCGGFETAAPVYSAFPSDGGKWLVWIARATLQTNHLSNCALSARIGHEDFISSLAFNHDETIVATSAGATMNDEFTPFIFLWDPEDGSLIRNIQLEETPAISLAYSPDDTLLASAGSGLFLWNTEAGSKVVSLAPKDQRYLSVLFSNDGSSLAAASETEIQIFKVQP